MTDGSPDRRKRSKWDDPRDPRLDSSRDSRRRDERERSSGTSGRSRWDDRPREDRREDRREGREERREERRDEHRRSRSPDSSRRRSRSPTQARSSATPSAEAKKAVDPAAAAAAAAARINASIQAKRGVQHVDVPPIRSAAGKASSPPATSTFNSEMYIADGDYIKDIEVNDLRNRYTLTKGATQKMIKEETGADVTTRGAYYPDKSMATPANPPLYLHITSTTKEGLEKAVQKIEELMKQELPNLVDERRFRRREPPEPIERDEYGRRKWPEEKVPVGLEPIPGFNLRASVVGHGGQYVKHIQQETRCRVQIKGRGSGFREHGTEESDEPLYLHVAGPDAAEVQRAKELCEDLITSVRAQYEEHKSQPQPARFPGYGGQTSNVYTPSMPHGSGSPPPPPPPPPSGPSQPPPPPPPTSPPGGSHGALGAPGAPGATAAGYSADPYAAYGYGGADPYAAYGGYAGYVQYYQAYYAQAQAVPGAPGAAPPGTSASPPGYGASRPPGM
ncbi:hypothetical protein FPQ18DRAFT_334512 [Pyronema domesticum]|nr:hypothetical protein FPQ18DRAFT_334512 [Pyronema domesticum]